MDGATNLPNNLHRLESDEIFRFKRPVLLNRITLTELIHPIPVERSEKSRFAQQLPAAVAYMYMALAYDLLAAFQPTNCFNHS